MKYSKIGCIADNTTKAREAYNLLMKKYNFVDMRLAKDEDVDLIIVLGGDGFMLHSLHYFMHLNIPIYGMNSGTVGFLLNSFDTNNLLDKLEQSLITNIHPLKMTATTVDGDIVKSLAINEVYLFRQTNQAAKIKISIDNEVRIEEMVCDGLIVATPAGSSAYNFSAGGSIIPLDANLLALTPISPFRPRRWRGALLPHTSNFNFEVIEPDKRPVSAVADFNEVRRIVSASVKEDKNKKIRLLFDPGHRLEERIILEQFEH